MGALQLSQASRMKMTDRWLGISMPLPSGSGSVISVHYFGPLPVTPPGNSYILLFTDRFSRLADMFAVPAAKFYCGRHSQRP